MSFLATLEIEGNPYEAFYTQLEAHQGVDDNGQTNTPVQCPYLYLELHLPPKNDLMLLEWALAASRPLDFKLKQYHDSVSVAPFELHKDDIPRLVRITAHTHEVCVDGACRRFPSSAMQYLDDARLNQDQWHILRLLAAGASNKEIASALHCAEPHAKALLKRTLLTINAKNRTHAAAVAARAGL